MIDARQELFTIVNKYMESTSAPVCERLKTELNYITQNENCAALFMAARGLANLSRKLGYYTFLRGTTGSSLIAYLLGITEFDPLKYNLPVEVFTGLDGDKIPDIDMTFDERFIPHAKKYMQDNFPDVTIWLFDDSNDNFGRFIFQGSMNKAKRSSENPSLWDISDVDRANMIKLSFSDFTMCAKIKHLVDITGIHTSKIPLDDAETFELILNEGTYEFGSEFVRDVVKKTPPKTFDDLVKIFGVEHGTYIWSKWDDNTGKRLVSPEMPNYSEIIPFQDDLMLYLIDKGIDKAAACGIMEHVRRGKALTAEHIDIMLIAGVPNWYIESCKTVKYLFPKAHGIAYAMMSFWLAWFKAHYPAEFQKGVEQKG